MTPVLSDPCYLHADKKAVDFCYRCQKPICEHCTIITAGRNCCPVCVDKHRKWRNVVYVILGAIALALSVGGVFLLRYLRERDPFEQRLTDPKLKEMIYFQEKDPCDKVKMLKLAEALYAAAEYKAVLKRSSAFWEKCGTYSRLRWVTYEAHKRLGQYDQAVADATALIDEHPLDWDFWWWRAEAYQRKGKADLAINDYRQSLSVQPGLDSIPFRLASLLEEAGRPCEGILHIGNFLQSHQEEQDNPDVLEKLFRLEKMSACAGYWGEGETSFDLPVQEPDAKPVQVQVRLNQAQDATLDLDLESSYTLISQALAERLKLEPGAPLSVWLGEESAEGRLVFLDSVEAGQAKARKVEAVILRKLPQGKDGVVGRSFLMRFRWVRDLEKQKVELSPRNAPMQTQ